eukprot:CAMPEP_0118689346 /NCGR_PEP_ID=MMETSP0800-20121206/9441_1 /TAXON_ID=210618 ORGANISM="Striatella unipunctata, Strain CCMP2910" /NCGR_SAMPLE_ID=MMETSP0800 /ASSEMBLY_ACC=CAM_ASM_000638 /LENGTH=234 /DNA_ID=CAMNT_0006586739 /DNA_START=365 /DNA_END=1066 /DNA_ORIENTATION=-
MEELRRTIILDYPTSFSFSDPTKTDTSSDSLSSPRTTVTKSALQKRKQPSSPTPLLDQQCDSSTNENSEKSALLSPLDQSFRQALISGCNNSHTIALLLDYIATTRCRTTLLSHICQQLRTGSCMLDDLRIAASLPVLPSGDPLYFLNHDPNGFAFGMHPATTSIATTDLHRFTSPFDHHHKSIDPSFCQNPGVARSNITAEDSMLQFLRCETPSIVALKLQQANATTNLIMNK